MKILLKETRNRKGDIKTATIVMCLLSIAILGFSTIKTAYGTDPPPTATISVWNITPIIGHNPDHSVEDTSGLTAQVATPANPQTIITSIDNTFHPEGPCGLIFWNPATNLFKWYGIGFGFETGDALNRNAPVLTGPAGTLFGAPTFQPGDVWVTKNGGDTGKSLYVNLKGTNNFRFYPMNTPVDGAFGVRVDQSTGNVYFTDFSGGTISRLNPSTNVVTVWAVGGHPHYVAIDASGKVFAPVAKAGVAGGVDAVVRIDPSTNNAVSWTIPGGGLTSTPVESTPDGVNFDSAGNLWFSLSTALPGAVGRLTPSTGEIAEYSAPAINSPQLIASTGSGALLQTFFTEGAGNSATILTQATAVATSDTIVTASSTTLTPTSSTTSFADSIRTPLTATIAPLVVNVTGAAPATGIVRFPMPTPMGGNSAFPNVPSGMTGVVLPSTIFGSYLDPGFAGNSAVFQVTAPGIIIAPPPPGPLKVSKFFTDSSFNLLPLDSHGNPMVNVTLSHGKVVSTNPGQIMGWVNVTNTSGSSLQSLKLNDTLPLDWVISPSWMPPKGSVGAIHVFYANGTSLANETEITQPSTVTVSAGNPETVHLAIANFTATSIGHPLMPGQSVLLSVKLTYTLTGTTQSAGSYPRNYTNTASAAAWTQPSFTGSQVTGTGSAFFVADAKVVS